MKILFDDGYISSRVVFASKKQIVIKIENSGVLKSGKKINIPDSLIKYSFEDTLDIKFACENDVDIVAASFVSIASQILDIRKILIENKKSNILIFAKIENKYGLENFSSILAEADGIMVARGDLGVEIDLSLVPKYQKKLVKQTNRYCKNVIIATQMLESMINCPRPTRAEVSDVANAIYDAASAVMLSAETAIGQYPFESIKIMKKVIKESELDFDNISYFEKESNLEASISSPVAIAAVKTAYSSNAKAFFVHTSSGLTARLISRWRPKIPIIALTTNKKIYNQLAIEWGVFPCFSSKCSNLDRAFEIMNKYALEKKLLSFGDSVIVTAGQFFGKRGSTNLMILDSIGHVVLRSKKAVGKKIHGKIKIIHSLDDADIHNKIIVIANCDKSYDQLFSKVKGVILQNSPTDVRSEKCALALAKKAKISLLLQADNASTLLSDGDEIVLDPEKKIAYFKH